MQSHATTGKPSRALRSRWSEVWEEPGAPEPLQMPLQGLLVTPLLTAIHESRMEEWMRTPAGQGSTGGIRAIRPAARVVYDLVEEAQDQLARLGAAEE